MTNAGEDNRELQLLKLRHLREWDENLSLEVKTRQVIDQRHRQECDKLHLVEINFHERDTLRVQQLQEVQKLVGQNNKIRVAIRRRQARDIEFTNRLVNKCKANVFLGIKYL